MTQAASATAMAVTFAGRVLVGLALSAVLAKKQNLPEVTQGPTKTTNTGGANGETFVLGRYATAGTFVCPPLAHGGRNKYGTYVIDLGMAGITINRVFVDGEPETPSATTHPDYGAELVTLPQKTVGWIIDYDGSQTAADPMMLDKYGADPDFPWTAAMKGQGRSYAILTFQTARKKYTGPPRIQFEVDGIPLYDPREDGTQPCGSGAQRWADPSTWAQTNNPAVMVYNILRGIALPDGSTWGGTATDDDLPVAEWAAAMNVCDEDAWADGVQEPRYRAGIEVNTDRNEPKEVIDQLLAACDGEIADEGGVWHIRVGPPALPLYFFTDDDIIVSEPDDFEPFPTLDQAVNAVHITFPDPGNNYENTEAERIIDAAEVARDGRQLSTSLQLPAVIYRFQCQRLASAWIADSRRFRVHRLTLPPQAAHVPPLSTV